MTSLKKLQSILVPVVVNYHGEVITLQARLERKVLEPDAWAVIAARETELHTQKRELDLDVERVIANVEGLKSVGDDDVFALREKIQQALRNVLAELEHGSTADASNNIEVILSECESWFLSLVPNDVDIAQRQEVAKARILEIQEQVKKLNHEIDTNRAEQIEFLAASWDVTEDDSEGSPILPVSVEVLKQLPPGQVRAILEEIEKKVVSR